jgi:L-ascorbate metabolism protein UlaG (beta-lactamase superfamily)
VVLGCSFIACAGIEIPQRKYQLCLKSFFGLLVTMDARQGVEIIKLINPRKAIPIHYNDYTAFESPLADFQCAVVDEGLQDRVHYLYHGDMYTFEIPSSRRQLAKA